MGKLKIHCFECGGSWKVDFMEDWKSRKARTCPICRSYVDIQIWNKQVIPAFCMMQDANMEILKDAGGYGTPAFSVDFKADKLTGREN